MNCTENSPWNGPTENEIVEIYEHSLRETESRIRLIEEDFTSGPRQRNWARGKKREIWVAKALNGRVLNLQQEDHNSPDVFDSEPIQIIDWKEGSYLRQSRYAKEKEPTLGPGEGTFVLPVHVLFHPRTNLKAAQCHAVVPFYPDDDNATFAARAEYWRSRRDGVRERARPFQQRGLLDSQQGFILMEKTYNIYDIQTNKSPYQSVSDPPHSSPNFTENIQPTHRGC